MSFVNLLQLSTISQHIYAPSAVHATSFSFPSNNFSDGERLAASWGLIRHGLHTQPDVQHFTTQRMGGLHPSYFPVHLKTSLQEARFELISFLDDSVGDIFDAVSATVLDEMLSC